VADAGEICRHFDDNWVNPFGPSSPLNHRCPPRFSHVMIGEDLPLVRNQKAGAENIEVYLRTAAR